jgi:hypothetical protein
MPAETLAERIKQLLGQGLTSTVVASAVGCEPSYISQLLEDPTFHQDVLLLRAQRAEGGVQRDTKWDEIESKALERAANLVDYVSRPNDLIRIAAMANAAKRRASELSGGSESAAQTVNIILPQSAALHLQMNSQSQVVEIDGRSMTALPTKNLVAQLANRKQQREELGTVTIEAPRLPDARERKKVESILDQIGYSDEPVPVARVI